jgi:carboxyl-terminal processing protease
VPRTRIGSGRIGVVVAAFGVLVVAPPHGPAAPAPDDQVRLEAKEFERLGQWERACEAYAKLLAENRQQPELRDRLQQCVRHLHQARRHRDPVYRTKVLALPVSQALDVYAEVLGKLHAQYVDRDKVPIDRLYRNGLDEFRAALAEPTFRQDQLAGVEPNALATLRDRLRDEWASRAVTELRDARQAVRDLAWEAQRLTGLNPTAVVMEFACGAAGALDEYTFFLTPGQPLDDPAVLSGDLAAYGLLLNWKDRQLVIDHIVPGTWAAGLGVQPGDRITHIGKLSVERLPPESVADLLRGDASAVTELTVQPAGSSAGRVLTVPGYAPSVMEAQMERDGIGYVRLANFQKTTPQELESALLRLRSEGMRVLVLDLRGNPGGSFTAAVQVADRFLPQGVIVVSTQGQLRSVTKTFVAQNPLNALDVPLIALVDGDTASAAEVVAGALKDNQRALLIGQTTYGKGSIQRLLQLQAGGGLRLTLARFVSPRGQPFANVGVTPHLFEPRREAAKDYQFDLALEQAARMLAMR